jgi:hypothetical protein
MANVTTGQRMRAAREEIIARNSSLPEADVLLEKGEP